MTRFALVGASQQARGAWMFRSAGVVLVAAVSIALGFAGPAKAATTQIGQTGSPSTQNWWSATEELVSPNSSVPASGGTLVSFQTQSSTCESPFWGAIKGVYDFQVLRPEGNNQYLVVGETGEETDPCTSQLVSYPVNIPVQAGDVLGVYAVDSWLGLLGSFAPVNFNFFAEPTVGATITVIPFGDYFAVDESATVVTDSDLTLAKPSDMTVDATSPAGAVVNYTTPAASDEDLSTVTVACSPVSGSTFAIEATTVTCTATDTDGDSNSPVSQTFQVTVEGAAQQLFDLLGAVTGVGPGTSLADKVASAQSDLVAADSTDACGTLGAFVNEVSAQTGKHIPAATAAMLIADAQRIEAVIPCRS